MKDRRDVLDLLILEIGDRASADIGDAHPDNNAENQRPNHQALPMLQLAGVVRIDVKRILIHRQQAEPGVIGLADRASRPVFEDLAGFKFFVVSSEGHGALLPDSVVRLFRWAGDDVTANGSWRRGDITNRIRTAQNPQVPASHLLGLLDAKQPQDGRCNVPQ